MARVISNAMRATPDSESHHDATSATDRPVDLVHLARYTMGNRDLEHEVLSLFAKQSVIYLERLRKAADQGTWKEAAHTLKGSARGIGAWQVADIVAAVEDMNCAGKGNGKTGNENELLQELSRSVEDANAFIEGLLEAPAHENV